MIEFVNDKLIRYRGLMWTPASARKATTCWINRDPIEVGDDIWRPVTNGGDRMRRIKATTVEALSQFVPYNGDRALGQNQYVSRYIDGRIGSPNLGVGLRFDGDPSDYHFVQIHRDDHAEFQRRIRHYEKLMSQGEREAAQAFVESLA